MNSQRARPKFHFRRSDGPEVTARSASLICSFHLDSMARQTVCQGILRSEQHSRHVRVAGVRTVSLVVLGQMLITLRVWLRLEFQQC